MRTSLYPLLTDETLALVLTFNLLNPSMSTMQSFKLIFNFQAGGLILLEYDRVMVNLEMFGGDGRSRIYTILGYVIGSVLLIISIIDIRRQRGQMVKQAEAPPKGIALKVISFLKCRSCLDGVNGLDVVNIGMIILSYISLSLKYGYDQFIEDKVSQAK